jgi:hypothetical protein
MNFRIWIIAGLGLLLSLAVIAYYYQTNREVPNSPWHEEEGREEEGRDSPEFTSRKPERMLPTRWSSLDDNGTNHRCNQDNTSQLQNETPCAASPADPEIAIVGANDYRTGNVAAGYYRTTDGGNSWQHSAWMNAPAANSCDFSGDPAIAADATGKFYAIFCAYFCNSGQGVWCRTSTNNGVSWSNPVPVATSNGSGVDIDKPIAACDYGLESPYLNNCYVVWMHLMDDYAVYFTRSTNGGASFDPVTRISQHGDGWCPAVTVGPAGDIHAVWFDQTMSRVRYRSSLDGGVTWGVERTVSYCSSSSWQTSSCGGFRINHYPAIAADISFGPNRGSVYIAYDLPHGTADSDILFSRSTNGGVSWSDTIRINTDNTRRGQFWPWIAVHPRTGDIGISWLDRRGDTQNCRYGLYGTVSSDGGTTWAPNFQISDTIANPTPTDFLGDYSGVTFSSMGFLSSWADTRNDDADAYAAWWNYRDSLVITSPIGGETWALQQPCTISWHFRYAPDTLILQLNRNYPSGNWDSLAVVPSASERYIWQSTGESSSNARLRMFGQHFPTVGDTSAADFAIGLVPPSHVVVSRIGNDIRIGWTRSNAPFYYIYSAPAFEGPYENLEGTTAGNVFLDLDAAGEAGKFYIVRASDEP